MLTTEIVETILARLPMCRIGLVGDLFLDRYFDIDATLNEPSIETGLTAYQVTGVRCYPGALGTVLNNLVALGVGQVVPISFLGDDGEGFSLRQLLGRMPSVDSSCLLTCPDRFTPTYSKPMLHDSGTVQELHRLDIKNRTPTQDRIIRGLLNHLEWQWATFHAVLVLDQVSENHCGVVTTQVRQGVCELARSDPKFVLADSRERIGKFRNVSVKPNEAEAIKAVGHADGFALAKQVQGDVYLTRGADGLELFEGNNRTVVPGYPVVGPIDICGAGDSCSAGIACARMAGATAAQAAAFGNLIASITVQQIGVTGTATPEQVRQRWAGCLLDLGGAPS
jgi:bifunctional ADP-heptose synthase (sugar kinase/adenylyltransferase)